MKPFKSGDATGSADGSVSVDVALQLSVAAADKALANGEKLARLRAEALGADPSALKYHTDSDGGMSSTTPKYLVHFARLAALPKYATANSGSRKILDSQAATQ